MAFQPDGKLLVAAPGESLSEKLIRLKEDGSLDEGFKPSNLEPSAYYTVAVQTDGKILVCRLGGGSLDVPALFRLNADGSPDIAFTRSRVSGGRVLATQADGKFY